MVKRRSRPVTRRPEPIYLRPTLAGWLFLLVAMMLGFAAGKSQASLLFVLFGSMMGAVAISAVMARNMVAAVRLRRDVPDRAWQNQPVHLGYHLRNTRKRATCLGIQVQEIAPIGIESASGYCLSLPARSAFLAGARFAARRRGRIDLRRVRIRTVFPFGLICASRHVELPASVVVWPAKGELRQQLLFRGAVMTSTAPPSPVSGGQDEFFGLREYRPDDNPRWIHWRKSAARGVPVVREMARPLPEILWVIVDTCCQDLSELGRDLLERSLRFAATLIDFAFARGYQTGLAIAYSHGAAVHAPAAGQAQRSTLLDALADADANTSCTLQEVLAGLPPGRLKQAEVVVVTTDAGRISNQALAVLRGRSGHLAVIGPEQLMDMFVDPLGRQEAPCR